MNIFLKVSKVRVKLIIVVLSKRKGTQQIISNPKLNNI
jgi:hypothetical protein